MNRATNGDPAAHFRKEPAPSGKEFFLSVVAPVRNEGDRLSAFVASIVTGRSHRFPLEIIVVDDCSSDDCCRKLGTPYSFADDKVQIRFITLPRWSGIPFARNVGAAAASAGILFVTDANVRFPANWDLPIRRWLAPGRALCATIADENSSFRAYGGALHLPSMGFNWLTTPKAFGGYVPLSACTGTILFTQLFRQAGGYDTCMPIYGAAEPEFSVRLWLSGGEIVSLPDLVLRHRFRPSSEREPFLDSIRLIQIHNYLRFGLLYLDPPHINRMLHHYASGSPALFREALRRVWAGDVWRRRAELQSNLPGRFEWFLQRFGYVPVRSQPGARIPPIQGQKQTEHFAGMSR